MYRVNYGQGQVSVSFDRFSDAQRCLRLARPDDPGAFIECYEAGSADDPGDWFRVKGYHYSGDCTCGGTPHAADCVRH
jgi:hypothetical protein